MMYDIGNIGNDIQQILERASMKVKSSSVVEVEPSNLEITHANKETPIK